MNTSIKSIAAIIVVSASAIGTASAMIPSTSLEQNSFPDAGIAPKIVLDIETGTSNLSGLFIDSSLQDDASDPGTKELRDLVGKHFI